MVRTSSAFPRGTRVSETVVAQVRGAALSTMFLLQNSSLSRQALLAGGVYLALLGIMLPLFPDVLLSPLLLSLAAAFLVAVIADAETSESPSISERREHLAAPGVRTAFTLPERLDARSNRAHDAIQLPHTSPTATSTGTAAAPSRPAGIDRALSASLMPRISHEIRTPLNAIIGFADLMAKEVFGPIGHPRYREYLNHIRDSGHDLLKASEDTLALTQLLADPVTPEDDIRSDLGQLAREAWTTVSATAAEHDVTFDPSVAKGIEVYGDRRALRQSIANILSSALGSAQPGAAIHFSADPGPERVRIEIKLTAADTRSDVCHETLGLSIARTLLDLQGTTLVHMAHALLGWRATTWFDVAAQPDFFTAPAPFRPAAMSRTPVAAAHYQAASSPA